jgi:hypothetical protein
MTLDEFFRKLPRTGWKLTPDGAIRACKDGRCPLERVAGTRGVGTWRLAAGALNITNYQALHITGAADGCAYEQVHDYRRLRARLLRHCGLAKRGQK